MGMLVGQNPEWGFDEESCLPGHTPRNGAQDPAERLGRKTRQNGLGAQDPAEGGGRVDLHWTDSSSAREARAFSE